MRNAKSQQHAQTLRAAMTDAERQLWQKLRARQLENHKFRRQVPIGSYIADFVCIEAGLIVELDGGQHHKQVVRDQQRDAVLQAHGFQVLRFWNDPVFKQTEAVLEVILAALLRAAPGQPPPSQPSPASGGRS